LGAWVIEDLQAFRGNPAPNTKDTQDTKARNADQAILLTFVPFVSVVLKRNCKSGRAAG